MYGSDSTTTLDCNMYGSDLAANKIKKAGPNFVKLMEF